AQQRIQDPGSGAGVARLDDQPIWRKLRGETGVVRLVLAAHHDHVLVSACEELRPATRAIQQRLAVEDGAELLGPRITGDLSGQRLQTTPVSTGQQQRPRGRWNRAHDSPSVPGSDAASGAPDAPRKEQQPCRDFRWSDRAPDARLRAGCASHTETFFPGLLVKATRLSEAAGSLDRRRRRT